MMNDIKWKYTKKPSDDLTSGLYLCQCKDHRNYFLNWNPVEQCWDDQEGDDFECYYEDMNRFILIKEITDFLDRKTGQDE